MNGIYGCIPLGIVFSGFLNSILSLISNIPSNKGRTGSGSSPSVVIGATSVGRRGPAASSTSKITRSPTRIARSSRLWAHFRAWRWRPLLKAASERPTSQLITTTPRVLSKWTTPTLTGQGLSLIWWGWIFRCKTWRRSASGWLRCGRINFLQEIVLNNSNNCISSQRKIK